MPHHESLGSSFCLAHPVGCVAGFLDAWRTDGGHCSRHVYLVVLVVTAAWLVLSTSNATA